MRQRLRSGIDCRHGIRRSNSLRDRLFISRLIGGLLTNLSTRDRSDTAGTRHGNADRRDREQSSIELRHCSCLTVSRVSAVPIGTASKPIWFIRIRLYRGEVPKRSDLWHGSEQASSAEFRRDPEPVPEIPTVPARTGKRYRESASRHQPGEERLNLPVVTPARRPITGAIGARIRAFVQ